MLTHANPPSGTFRGTNFMTPEWKAYYKLREGYAELSTGRGLYDEPIFGVTIRPETQNEKRSKMFYTESEAIAYIESLS